MKRIILSALAMGVIVSFYSCQKEQTQTQEAVALKFFASYNGDVSTKAPIAFPVGNKSTIIGYTAGATVTSATMVAGTPLEATGAASGALTPVTPLYLPKGSYDFYSVSLNSSSPAGMTFTSGISAQLSNTTDYLWAKAASVAQGGTVTLSYYHKAVGMDIEITSGTGVSALTVTAIKFTPAKPDVSSKMSLADGAIGAAAVKDALAVMALSGSKGTYIMLPLVSQSLSVEVTVNATIGGTAVTGKSIYSCNPCPGIYRWDILHSFPNSLCKFNDFLGLPQFRDWTTQTISGISLIES